MSRTLFIAPTRIGDAVLASAVLRHVIDTSPETQITIATSPLAADLFLGVPNLARIIPMQKRTYNRHWLMLWRETAGTFWDAIWDMRGSAVSHVLLRRSLRSFYTVREPMPKVKQYERMLKVEALPYPMLWPRAEDAARAIALMPEGERYLILAPTANWAPKEWPVAHFVALAQQLLEGACKGYRPVVICAGHERARAVPLLEALAPHTPIDLTTGEAPLLTLYACMRRAHGFIGNDSGLMHMAAAAGIPTLGLFGPTEHAVYQPWGRRAAYVHSPDKTMDSITPEQAVTAFETLLAHS